MKHIQPAKLAPHGLKGHASAGFTLIELIMVLVVVAVASRYAAPKVFNTADVTLNSQSSTLASDLRRAQLLATVLGTSLCIVASANQYSVRSATTTCLPTPTTDPATGQPFVVTLQNGATIADSIVSPPLIFNSLGQPNRPASYTLRSTQGAASSSVNVAPLTGYVSSTPP